MKIVIDMNLSPEWEDVFHLSPHAATHWSRVGALDAPDEEILSWARAHEHIVLTHDLDFGAILAQREPIPPAFFRFGHRMSLPCIWGRSRCQSSGSSRMS